MKKLIVTTMLLILGGCTLADVKVEMLSERTALENQVLGSYNALDTRMLLTASVRGVDSEGNIGRPPASSREQQDVIAAMQTIDFHADDIDLFKQAGWVGENNRGLIEPFELIQENVPDHLKDMALRFSREEFTAVVNQINESRLKIMRHVIYMNEAIREENFDQVVRIFAKLEAERAAAGTRIQTEDGRWTIKEEKP
jgi:uncharacterized protein YdbL (DUF1318 family)